MKVSKIDNQLVVSIPFELAKKLGISEGSFVKVYELKPGTIAIEVVKEKERISFTLGEQDMPILKKLLSFKFEQRIPENVDKQLTVGEKKVLAELMKKRFVTIYKDAKYPKGVYNVPNYVYRQYLDQTRPKKVEPVGVKGAVKEVREAKEISKEAAKEEIRSLTPVEKLERFGYVIAENESDAKHLSDQLASNVRKKDIVGIRGFDRKYYIVKNSFARKYAPKIKSVLRTGSKSADKIADEIGVDRQGTAAILTIMNEEGELIEKRKGTFALAD